MELQRSRYFPPRRYQLTGTHSQFSLPVRLEEKLLKKLEVLQLVPYFELVE